MNSNNKWFNFSQFLCQDELIVFTTNYMNSSITWGHIRYEFSTLWICWIIHDWTNICSSFFYQGEHYLCPISDRLCPWCFCLMLIQMIMQTPHLLPGEASIYPQTRKSCLETSQKVICFKKIKKILIHFCRKQCPGSSWKLFGNKTRNHIGWPCKKIDGTWSLSVQYVKQLTDGSIISSHQNYVDSYSGEKQKEVMWIHHFIILQFSMPNSKRFQTSILFMTILCLFVTSTTTRNRNIRTSLKTCLPLSICGWVRGLSLFQYI